MQRRLRRGELSKKEYEKFLKSLPDVADKVAPADPDDDDDDDLDAGANGVHHD